MGAKLARYSFVPKENEQIDAVITVEEEARSVIHGVVKDSKGKYIKDAVVKLFRAMDSTDYCALKPITHTFTDDCGQFLFGPLLPGKRYVVKVWTNDVKICAASEESDDDWDEVECEAPPKCNVPEKRYPSHSDKYHNR